MSLAGYQKSKILFDGRFLDNENTGLAKYSWSVLKTCIEADYEIDLYVLPGTYSRIVELLKEKGSPGLKVFVTKSKPIGVNIPHFIFKYFGKKVIYFYPHFNPPLLLRNTIFVVHDILPIIISDYFTSFGLFKRLYFFCRLNLSLLVFNSILVSKTTYNDVERIMLGKSFMRKRQVILEAKPIHFPSDNEVSVDIRINDLSNLRYLLYIGDRRSHKNLHYMLDVFESMREKGYPGSFLIAGSKKDFSNLNLEDRIKESQNVYSLGFVSQKELELLMSKMEALFFLTKYEGFGLPILEAAVLHKKIITSKYGGACEIAPSTALKVDPSGLISYNASTILSYLNDDSEIRISDSYFIQFNWINTVEAVINVRN